MKAEIKEALIIISILICFVFGLNHLFKKGDDLINSVPRTLTYKVYYTESNVVTKQASNVYWYTLSSHRGSNCLQVHRNNCSTWVPILKHIGVLDSIEDTTAPIEIISFQ